MQAQPSSVATSPSAFASTTIFDEMASPQLFSRSLCVTSTFSEILPASAHVENVVSVAAGSEYGEGPSDIAYPIIPTNLPGLCAVTINVTSSESSSFRFGLFLPDEWNERFLAVGNGGFAGGINWHDMGAGVSYGFASMSTDTGHNSTAIDLSWALNDPESQSDFGWRAMHGSIMLAKDVVAQYYSKNPEYSYYSGCSTGGRQGFKEAELFPETFDGLLVGAPAWYTAHLQPWTTKIATHNLPESDPKHIEPASFSIIAAEALRQCDSLDGVEDGIISSPELCTLDTSKLLCGNEGVDDSACLTPEQIQTLRKIYADYKIDGEYVMSGMEVGSEAQWVVLLGSSAPVPLGDGYIQYFLLNDTTWDWTQYNDSLVKLAETRDPGKLTADDYDFSAIKNKGGKVLLFHGLADAFIPPGSSRTFHSRVIQATEGPADDFFKFFQVPGLQHCSGTAVDAPWFFSGSIQTSSITTDVRNGALLPLRDSKHDALLALMNWVENGKEVKSIISTAWKNQTDPESGVLRERLICPHPKKAVYDGNGDVDSTRSWNCR